MWGPGRRAWTGPRYRVTVDFRAPLDFVYRWCTDYRPDDGRLEGEPYRRRILSRSARRVVFEDLEEDRDGWNLSRVWVDLHPPARWHAERRGNRREYSVDYRLRPLAPGSTRLEFDCRRRTLVPERPVSKAGRERAWTEMWNRFRRALERDYRRQRTPGGAGRSRRPRDRARR
jgi:hypothetical protein